MTIVLQFKTIFDFKCRQYTRLGTKLRHLGASESNYGDGTNPLAPPPPKHSRLLYINDNVQEYTTSINLPYIWVHDCIRHSQTFNIYAISQKMFFFVAKRENRQTLQYIAQSHSKMTTQQLGY